MQLFFTLTHLLFSKKVMNSKILEILGEYKYLSDDDNYSFYSINNEKKRYCNELYKYVLLKVNKCLKKMRRNILKVSENLNLGDFDRYNTLMYLFKGNIEYGIILTDDDIKFSITKGLGYFKHAVDKKQKYCMNCTNCTDTIYSFDCVNSTDCKFCSNLNGCKHCVHCSQCINSENLENCKCINSSKKIKNSFVISDSEECDYCKCCTSIKYSNFCESCVNCISCYQCNNVINGDHCYQCDSIDCNNKPFIRNNAIDTTSITNNKQVIVIIDYFTGERIEVYEHINDNSVIGDMYNSNDVLVMSGYLLIDPNNYKNNKCIFGKSYYDTGIIEKECLNVIDDVPENVSTIFYDRRGDRLN